jgi:hypothetical protein
MRNRSGYWRPFLTRILVVDEVGSISQIQLIGQMYCYGSWTYTWWIIMRLPNRSLQCAQSAYYSKGRIDSDKLYRNGNIAGSSD